MVNTNSTHYQTIRARVKEIVGAYNASKRGLSASPPNLIDAILSASTLPPADRSVSRIHNEIGPTTGGGFETTAQTLRAVIYHVYSKSSVLYRLRAELKLLSPTGNWTLTQLTQLPYLTAVLKEGLRLTPGIGTRMARVSDQSLLYNGDKSPKAWSIPAGTPVGMTTLFMHLDEEIFPEGSNFKPERWLGVDDDDKKWLESHFHPFSRGTRMCLGIQ
jgi:cytochrome P450